MRKSITLLALLGGVAGCSDNPNSTGPARDTVSPTLTLSASQSEIRGGEMVAISVTATDNVDPSVTYTLQCSSGTLTGNMLLAPTVSADTVVTCTARANDAAGNAGTGSVNITVKAANPTVMLPAGTEAMVAGGSSLLFVEDLVLGQTEYSGTIDGTPVTLQRVDGNALMFTAPLSLGAGAHRLSFEIAGKPFAFDLTVSAAITVANPKARIVDMLNAGKALLQGQLASATTAQRTVLQGQIDQIDAAIAGVPGLSNDGASALASILAANGAFTGLSASSLFLPIKPGPRCDEVYPTFASAANKAIKGAIFFTGAGVLAVTVAKAAPATVVADIVLAGVGFSAGLYMMTTYGWEAKEAYAPMFTFCWEEREATVPDYGEVFSSQSNLVTALAVVAKKSFVNKTPRAFRVQRSFSPGSAVANEVVAVINKFVSTLSAIPVLPGDLRTELANIRIDGTEFIPTSRLSLGSLSRTDISGSLSVVNADTVRLTFTYNGDTPPAENIDFSFTVNRTDEEPISVPAQLAVSLPEADDAALSLIQDTPTNSSVQVRNATSLEVVTPPMGGTVTLNNDGTFRYTPSLHFFGADSFTYRARNSEGVSKTATVSLSVTRKFDGVWIITTRSTTTSQSSPGLCPNETNSFSAGVTKISDTQYSSSYGGYDISLTMSSPDDASGPRGNRTVTYQDDPGSTTEAVSISIPDSRRLVGTSLFSYTGPNGSFCSGSVEITGTR